MTTHEDFMTPVNQIAELIAQRDALLRFKTFVHDRLTAAGVPTHPDGPHTREGCRIGDRLDLVLGPIHPGGLEGKYGTIYSSNKKFHASEPVFLLRATDQLAPSIIRDYASLCKRFGCEQSHYFAALDHAQRIANWQSSHQELVKLPD